MSSQIVPYLRLVPKPGKKPEPPAPVSPLEKIHAELVSTYECLRRAIAFGRERREFNVVAISMTAMLEIAVDGLDETVEALAQEKKKAKSRRQS